MVDRPGVNAFAEYKKNMEQQASELKDKTIKKIGYDLKNLCNKATGNGNSEVISVKTDLKEWLDSDSQNAVISICLFDGGQKIVDIPIKIDKCELYSLPDMDVLKSEISKAVVDQSADKSAVDKIKQKMNAITQKIEGEKREYWDQVNKAEGKEAPVVKDESAFNTAAEVFEVVKTQYPADWAMGTSVPIGGITYVITGEDPANWVLTRQDLATKVESKK